MLLQTTKKTKEKKKKIEWKNNLLTFVVAWGGDVMNAVAIASLWFKKIKNISCV